MPRDDYSTEDRRIIHAGLKLYCKNARAASGTLIGLGKKDQAQKLQEEADDVEERLAAKFDDQGTLALAGAK